ncbi:raffinose/stachyose/melibiose transport system substrate-binding protein [Kribbella orskensis]|uniref:Raffinose/stachyose/melibiose transport system substrate-binding protein n=1 Tax=Kribbella orskensis TaxID=2512216 RepID=A0ABY2BF26_9ACTN|nr:MULTISPECIES: extracellular solute-binding protein [Kribbella]TCN36908.1 raffinose/stachyose/melibiose transport system substrate-binding protein [Kribbella sp. VKM Ac-2500]TCO18332.1 raffinose/stachyose/melibiose transport system substrate-binding protein [Kribbella orskensis]
MASEIIRPQVSRRRLLQLMGGVAVAGTLAGCGGGNSAGGSGGGPLKVIGAGSQEAGLRKALDEYKKLNSSFDFNLSFSPADQLQTALRAQLAAGNAPDMHAVYPGNGSAMSMVQLSKANLLTDLSDQAWTQKIPTGFKGAYQQDGKTFIFSPGTSVLGAIYNKKAFAKAGVEVPTTWSELLTVCETLKKKGIVPLALGAQTPWVTQLINYALVPGTVYSKQPDFDDKMAAGSATFAGSGWADAMNKYLELQKRGFFNDNPNGTTYEQATSMVGTGKAAMAVQVSAVLQAYRDAAPSPDDLGMFPLPATDTVADNWIPGGIVVGLAVSAKSKKADEARKFIEFCGQPDMINTWAEAVACVPLYSEGAAKVDPVLKPFLPYLSGNKAVPFMDQRWPNAEVQPTHFAVVQELLGGKTTVDGALKKMDEAYRKTA